MFLIDSPIYVSALLYMQYTNCKCIRWSWLLWVHAQAQRLAGWKKDTTSIFWVMSYGLCPRSQLRKVHDGMPDCIDIT